MRLLFKSIKTKIRRYALPWIFMLSLFGKELPLEARYEESDADSVDKEEQVGSENYNDEWSYRPPRRWELLYEPSRLFFHANAGSYNIRRFMYFEDIKIETDPEKPMYLGFKRKLREYLIESEKINELRIGFNQLRPLKFSILLDGGTYKEYGDIGLATAFELKDIFETEFQFWSVDHYYNSKSEFPQDTYAKRPSHIRYTLQSRLKSLFAISYEFNLGTPMHWLRNSQSYEYKHSDVKHLVEFSFAKKEPMGFELLFSRDQKKEDKLFHLSVGDYQKSMNRTTTSVEARFHTIFAGAWELVAAVIRLDKDTDFAFNQDPTVTDDLIIESNEEDIRRAETGYYLTLSDAFNSGTGFQYGIFANNVAIARETSSKENVEIKLQTAWELGMSENAATFINFTWDLDQLGADFPYSKRPFKPWGGGNMQFRANF